MLKNLLKKNGIKANVQGRTKSLYGIHCKMIRSRADIHKIMDRIGLRIIVFSVPECYSVLGILHSHFRPIPETFDDYIGLSKNNAYQSLHTCVYPVRDISHKPIELQIRTELMHRKAEYGVAAHWRYKNGDIDTVTNQWASQWIDNLIDHHKEVKSVDSFIEILYNQVYKNHIVVFGNAGQIIRFPENATVQDHVKRFNPDSASYFKAKVNEEIARMNQALRDGDTVEIIDDKNPIPREHVGELMRNGQSY